MEEDDRHYAFIPKTTLKSKEYKSMSAQSRCVYVAFVAERAGRDEPFNFPYKDIQKTTGFCVGTISKAIKQMEANGFFSNRNHGGLERNASKYTLDPSWLEIGGRN